VVKILLENKTSLNYICFLVLLTFIYISIKLEGEEVIMLRVEKAKRYINKRKLLSSTIFILMSSILYIETTNFNFTRVNSFIDQNDEEMSINNPIMINGYEDIFIKEDLAFMVGINDLISILNISDPSEPITLFEAIFTDFNTGASQIGVINDIAYLLFFDYYNSLIESVNTSNLNNVTIQCEKNLEFGFDRPRISESYIIPQMLIAENYAFISLNWEKLQNYKYLNYSISIFDFSNASDIQEIGFFTDSGTVTDIYYYNNLIYLVQQKVFVWDHETEEFIWVGNNLLEIINVTDKANPEKLFTKSLTQSPTSIFLYNDNLFIGYKEGGFEIFSIEGTILSSIYSNKYDVFTSKLMIINDILFLLNINGIMIFDISNINEIQFLGKEEPKFKGGGAFRDFAVKDDYVFAVRSGANVNLPLFIFDCSDLSNPTEIYPLVIDTGERMVWLTKIILGYIISPLIGIIIIALITAKFLKRRKI